MAIFVLDAKLKVISQAQGSAYIEMGNTKVICSVYGPREVKKRDEFSMEGQLCCDFKFATFSCPQRRSHLSDNEEKELSQQLLNALSPAVCLVSQLKFLCYFHPKVHVPP